MASNIVLPNLPNWVQQHITAVYTAKSTEDFSSAFDTLLSGHAVIMVNGKHMSREAYKNLISGERTGEASAEVTFTSTTAVPSDDASPEAIGTGVVAASFKAVIFGRFIVFGAAQSSTVSSTLIVTVAQDPSVPHPNLPGRGGAFDARRVIALTEVVTDAADPVVPPTGVPGA